jgi:hypothetical protein
MPPGASGRYPPLVLRDPLGADLGLVSPPPSPTRSTPSSTTSSTTSPSSCRSPSTASPARWREGGVEGEGERGSKRTCWTGPESHASVLSTTTYYRASSTLGFERYESTAPRFWTSRTGTAGLCTTPAAIILPRMHQPSQIRFQLLPPCFPAVEFRRRPRRA